MGIFAGEATMTLRRTLFRIMLWSLGIAAATGVYAAIRAPDQTDKLVGTAMMTWLLALLLLWATRLTDRRPTLVGGLTGMTSVVVQYAIALLLIWEWGLSDRVTQGLEQNLIAAFVLTPPLVRFLCLKPGKENRTACWIGVLSVIGALTLVNLTAWRDTDDNWDRWWGSAGCVFGFGVLMACGVVSTAPRAWWWRWIGLIACPIAMTLVLLQIWKGKNFEWQYSAVGGVGAIIAYINIVLLIPLRPMQRWVRWVASFALIALSITYDLYVYRDWPNDYVERAMTATGIVAACASIALAALARMNRIDRLRVPDATAPAAVSLTCPHCDARQLLPVGDSACTRCGLRLHLRLEEPRCPNCDYLLYMIKSDRCPECGLELAHVGHETTA
jgi:uncharacterized membrane protein